LGCAGSVAAWMVPGARIAPGVRVRLSAFPWLPSWCASRARFGFAGTCIRESDGEALRAWVQKRQQQLEAGLRSMWANDHAGTNQVQNKNARPNQKQKLENGGEGGIRSRNRQSRRVTYLFQ
jgi:hypothetical protein